MGNIFSQFYFLPAPPITEKNCPDQTGRVSGSAFPGRFSDSNVRAPPLQVFLVTGGYTGVGLELCKILYAHNATVWIAGRSESKAQNAISAIRGASPKSSGQIHFLCLDLSDLSTIKPAVRSFTAQQPRLDVLVNNAGVRVSSCPQAQRTCFTRVNSVPLTWPCCSQVMHPPKGSVDAQGNELHVGTNCVGHFLLYQLLLPLLTKTAAASPTATVRVAWAASVAVHVACPGPEGMVLDEDGRPKDQGVELNYGQTKVGNVFLASECAKTTPQTGVVHAAFNPGNLRTELQRHWTSFGRWITVSRWVSLPGSSAALDIILTTMRLCRILSWCSLPSTVPTPSSGQPSPPS